MRRTRPAGSLPIGGRLIPAVAVVMALLLAGCGGGSSTASSGDVSTSDSSSGGQERVVSPLAEFFGVSDQGDQEAEYRARERDRQDWVATCMANEGFEYQGRNPDNAVNFESQSGDGPEFGTREWTAIYGFGISTQSFDQRTVGDGLVGYHSESGTAEAYAEPNQGYLDSLSDEERNAYYAALYGDDQGVEWDDSLTEAENQAAVEAYYADNPPSGCDNRSYDEGAQADPFQRLYEDFGDELSSMYERVLADPEIIAALDKVSRCANDAGFTYVDEQTVNDDIYRRLEPVNAEVKWPLEEAQVESMSEAEIADLQNQQPELSAEGKALLAEIQKYEIEFGLAVYDCGGGDLYPLYQKVSVRIEQEFIDAHRAELEAYRPD